MAKPCVPKLKPNDINCKYTIDYPPISNSENFYLNIMPSPKIKNYSNYSQNITSRGELNFQCHFEERKRRLELKRKKMIQKLKGSYDIDVEGMHEDVVREILMKMEVMEKEKRERDKKRVERTVVMINRILEEQKYKSRDKKIFRTFRKKPHQKPTNICDEITQPQEESSSIIGEAEAEEINQNSSNVESTKSLEKLSIEKIDNLPKCKDLEKAPEIASYNSIISKPKPTCVSVEKLLESSPKEIIFQNYEKGKVYLQDLKITNIGLETVHCRYLGIAIHERGEDQYPIGVAIRDSVKLRPGLSCATKIRLFCQDDTKELKCSVVYETRRKKKPHEHSWFFVKILCVPLRAVVRVFPIKINFPTLSWCEATGPQNAKLLNKTIKIENSGGKSCTCKITYEKFETFPEFYGENNEGKFEELKAESTSSKLSEKKSKGTKSEEFLGECYSFCEESAEMAAVVLEELVGNVFEMFRFSPKYHIEIGPYCTKQIEVRFIPHYKGFHHELFYIQFENCHNMNEQMIELSGDIQKIPLTTEPQVVDLKTCIINSGVYAGTFKIYNKSKGPYSIFVKVPSCVKKHAHVYPRATTILPLNCSEFSVRIYPRLTLAKDAPLYYKQETQILEFPIFIHPANAGVCKLDYIKIYVFALITDTCLELSPSCLDFGTVNTLETVRAELKLTNHSLAMQEFGFLNLPKGVRIEPNMGFGQILPKEYITLYVLYSPYENDLFKCGKTQENHEFQLVVTSIAKYGGFHEKLDESSAKSCDALCLGEDYGFETPKVNSFSEEQCIETEDYGECDEDSSIEGEEFMTKTIEEENKIREFLKNKNSLPKEISQSEISSEEKGECGEYEGSEDFRWICSSKADLNVVKCQAVVLRPRCQLSETFIQLPATPCSSFSLYRFRIFCGGDLFSGECFCGFQKISRRCSEKNNFIGRFEFQYSCPSITLEPASGCLQSGDCLPITIIFRPNFPTELSETDLSQKQFPNEKKSEKSLSNSSSKVQKKKLKSNENELEEFESYEAEEKSVQYMNPFKVETKVECVIKTKQCNEENERTEIHQLVLVCPATKPNFVYLGDSPEINFDKVFVGTKARAVVQVQNLSLERISPSTTLLNPVGPFYFPGGIRRAVVDPEHSWRQPVIYAPSEVKGIEKQFFEVYYKSTNISLTVRGEGIQPEYKITPAFGCCLIEPRPGQTEEVKIEIENLSTIKLNIHIKTQYLKKGGGIDNFIYSKEDLKPKPEKDGTKERRKSKNSGGENCKFWDETPEQILRALVDFETVENVRLFSLVGLNEDEVSVPSSGKQIVKIQFTPPVVEDDTVFAIGYAFMLERVSLLKEIVVIAKISKGK